MDEIVNKIDKTRTFNDYEHYGAHFAQAEDHGTAHISGMKIISHNVLNIFRPYSYFFNLQCITYLLTN